MEEYGSIKSGPSEISSMEEGKRIIRRRVSLWSWGHNEQFHYRPINTPSYDHNDLEALPTNNLFLMWYKLSLPSGLFLNYNLSACWRLDMCKATIYGPHNLFKPFAEEKHLTWILVVKFNQTDMTFYLYNRLFLSFLINVYCKFKNIRANHWLPNKLTSV